MRALVVLFLVTLPFINPYLRGDGVGYYAYVRSLVIDGDVQFENEYRRGDAAWLEAKFEAGELVPEMWTATGHAVNFWAVGPSLLWSPFFLAGHAVALVLHRFAGSPEPDGFSWPYLWFCAAGTALLSFVGLLLAYRTARRFVSAGAALLGTAGVWFASSLPVYMYLLPFQAHALAGFTVSLFLWYWLRRGAPWGAQQWLLWGAAAGLMVGTYLVNGVLLLVALAEWVHGALRQGSGRLLGHAALGMTFAAGLLVAMMPQFLIKWRLYGWPFESGYGLAHGQLFFWGSPRLWQLGFSAEHGMFLWTPVLLASLLGLPLLWRRERWVGGVVLAAFAGFYYVIASYHTWHGLSAFGSRFFVSCTPVFVLGLATTVEHVRPALARALGAATLGRSAARLAPAPTTLVAALLLLLVSWNLGFVFQWSSNLIPNRGPVDLGLVARNQFQAVPRQAGSFLVRYLTKRGELIGEVERGDLRELPEYEFRR